MPRQGHTRGKDAQQSALVLHSVLACKQIARSVQHAQHARHVRHAPPTHRAHGTKKENGGTRGGWSEEAEMGFGWAACTCAPALLLRSTRHLRERRKSSCRPRALGPLPCRTACLLALVGRLGFAPRQHLRARRPTTQRARAACARRRPQWTHPRRLRLPLPFPPAARPRPSYAGCQSLHMPHALPPRALPHWARSGD